MSDAMHYYHRAVTAEAKVGDLEMSLAVESAKRATAEAKAARVEALAGELESLAEPYSTGSMFFDDAPTTRLRARASVRRDVAAAIRAALDGE